MSDSDSRGRVARIIAKSWQKAEYDKIDRIWLAKLSDKDLASWQSDHPADSPQYILAQFEWSRRLTADQISATIKAARGQAWIGIAGVIIGVLLSLLLR
jgi:hypothetical protein